LPSANIYIDLIEAFEIFIETVSIGRIGILLKISPKIAAVRF